jgi:MOSC domain-containing protein YiiM
MHIVSVNVSQVEVLLWKGRETRTGFRKHPIRGRVPLRGVNLLGDVQADRTVHGGRLKSVYVYPSEHYRFWRKTLDSRNLGWGAFGENLTTADWPESSAHVGDVVRIGTAVLQVTQPRSPCYKINAAFGRTDMIERFHRSGRTGFYLGPIAEGEIGEGDSIELLSRKDDAPAISELHSSTSRE